MRFSMAWLFLLGIPALHLFDKSATPGLKMIVRNSSNGHSSEHTLYLQSDRKRMEYRSSMGRAVGPRLALITQCDLGQMYELNLDSGEYVSAPFPPKPLSKEEMEARGMRMPEFNPSAKTTLHVETTTVDTGERKEVFGHTARHVITTRKEIPLEGSQREPQQMVNDAWYIDLDTSISCDMKKGAGRHVLTLSSVSSVSGPKNLPMEKAEFVDHGTPETGFAIESKMTSQNTLSLPDGSKKEYTHANETRVTELVEGPLDPELFSVPSGFRKVDQIERNPSPTLAEHWSAAWETFKSSVARFF
jgi:hypothetical protein